MELGISLETISCVSQTVCKNLTYKQNTKMIFAIVVAAVTLPEGGVFEIRIGREFLAFSVMLQYFSNR